MFNIKYKFPKTQIQDKCCHKIYLTKHIIHNLNRNNDINMLNHNINNLGNYSVNDNTINYKQLCLMVFKGTTFSTDDSKKHDDINSSDKTDINTVLRTKKLSVYGFNTLVHEFPDVFCFYRVLIGYEDRRTFARCLVIKVNEELFEVDNLENGGMSLNGWLEIMRMCATQLAHQYRLFFSSKGNLYYVTSIGSSGSTVDILLDDSGHMQRVRIHGRYPTIAQGSPQTVIQSMILHCTHN